MARAANAARIAMGALAGSIQMMPGGGEDNFET
jgi:hypothetical protein